MKYKIFFTLCLSFLLLRMEGKDPPHGDEPVPDPPDIALTTKLLDERISELIAKRLSVYNGMPVKGLATIDEFMNEELFDDEMLDDEGFEFPADDLYGAWDTTGVNPYRNKEIAYPDSFKVDCSSFVLPIDGNIKVTSKFGVRGRRMHSGIDLKVQKGDTIRSAFSGKVRIRGYQRRGYGNYLVIRHPNGLETVYGHLSAFLVAENEVVDAGQPIGLGGSTGRSTGTHLHFEARFLGQALNPGNIVDFEHDGTLYNDQFVLYKGNFGKNVNIYTSNKEQIVYHRVKKGETLGSIALKYKTSVGEICRLNGLSTRSVLRVGQALRCGTTVVNANKQDDVALKPTLEMASVTTVAKATQQAPAEPVYYRVKAGDTLGAIATKHGISISQLCEMNNITHTTILRIGRSLRCS